MEQIETRTNTQCMKVKELRKIKYENLDEWLKNPNNIYVGRRGRIWITETDKSKRIFHYSESKWANPYKVTKEMSLEESLRLYRIHLEEKGLLNQIEELRGKTLGCFCEQNNPCHAKILRDLLKN